MTKEYKKALYNMMMSHLTSRLGDNWHEEMQDYIPKNLTYEESDELGDETYNEIMKIVEIIEEMKECI